MEDIKTINEALNKTWQVFKKHSSGEITDGEWDAIISETSKIWANSNRDQLVMDIIVAFLNEMERRQKAKK